MKKPINKFAVALWVLAVVVIAAEAMQFVTAVESAKQLAAQDDHLYLVAGATEKILLAGLLAAAQLSAFGVIIELIDQIRWNALQRSK